MQPGSNIRSQLITFESKTDSQSRLIPDNENTPTTTNSSGSSQEMRLPGHVQPLKQPLQQLTHMIVPNKDSNTNVRTCYIALCSTRSSTQRNLLRLLSLLKEFNRNVSRSNGDLSAEKMLEEGEFYRTFAQMVVSWRKNGRGSIVAFAIKHRNIDSLLINSLKMVFFHYGGPQNIRDRDVDIIFQQAWNCLELAGFAIPRHLLVEQPQGVSVIISLSKEEENLIFQKQEQYRKDAEKREKQRIVEHGHSLHPVQMQRIERRNMKVKGKLKPLQSCIFYSLLH